VPSLLLRDDGIEFFLLFLYLLLAHIELLLLLHAVVAHPELDGEAQERRQGIIMVNDTKLIIAESCITGYIYNILKFFFSYSEPDNLCCFVKLLFWIVRHLFLLIAFSIDRGEDLKLVNNLLVKRVKLFNCLTGNFSVLFNKKVKE
jgi:hypothetical protein